MGNNVECVQQLFPSIDRYDKLKLHIHLDRCFSTHNISNFLHRLAEIKLFCKDENHARIKVMRTS